MLRNNATKGIKLPENRSNWTTELVLKQWKITNSIRLNAHKVRFTNLNQTKPKKIQDSPIDYVVGKRNIFEVPMECPLDTKLMKNKGKVMVK